MTSMTSRTLAENAAARAAQNGIVGEQRSVLLHRRSAPGAVDDDVVDVESLHLGDEIAHPPQRGLLAAGMDLERSAAALQRRNQHFAAVGGEHPRGGSIDVREERVLHAPGEHRDAHDTLSSWAEMARRSRPEIGEAQRWCHVVETAQRSGAPGARSGLHPQRLAESERLRERNRGCDGAHPSWVGKHREECGA